MKTFFDRSRLGFLLGVALLCAGVAQAQTHSGACVINGACSVKDSIQCTQAITNARLGGGNGAYVGDGTTCTLDCGINVYAANNALAFAFRPGLLVEVRDATPLPPMTVTSWTVKNASGAVVASGTTAPPLTFPVVIGGGSPAPLTTSIPPGAFLVSPAPAIANGQRYTLTVQAKDSNGRLCAQPAWADATPPGRSPAPSNVAGNAGTLTWTPPDAARYAVSSYTVRSGTSSSGPFSVVGSGITTPSFTLPASVAGSVFLVVSSVNATGEGPASAPLPMTIIPAPPAAPVGVVARGGSGQIEISWSPVPGATSYSVLTSKTQGGPYQSAGLSNLTTPSGTVTGLQPGVAVKYYLVVFAKNAGGLSPKSAEVSATTLKTMQ